MQVILASAWCEGQAAVRSSWLPVRLAVSCSVIFAVCSLVQTDFFFVACYCTTITLANRQKRKDSCMSDPWPLTSDLSPVWSLLLRLHKCSGQGFGLCQHQWTPGGLHSRSDRFPPISLSCSLSFTRSFSLLRGHSAQAQTPISVSFLLFWRWGQRWERL